MKKLLQCIALGLGLALLGTANAEPPNDKPVTFELDAQPLDKALTRFAQQADVQVVFYSEISAGITAPRVHGTFTKEAALQQLLANTQLQFQFINDRKTVAIRQRVSPAVEENRDRTQTSLVSGQEHTVLAMAAETVDTEERSVEPDEVGKTDTTTDNTMVVTGTNIRGTKPVGSPLMVFSQEDFIKSGATTMQDFLNKLPQNFGGGQTTYNSNNYAATSATPLTPLVVDFTEGAGVNLRGLGEGTTLVLLNGRRMAPTAGTYVDVSMIPLSAVDRVEILTDSGSAQYGSDAIGGVVNIIMRDSYQGGQTQLNVGTTTQGGGEEFKVAQSIGMGGKFGNVLVSFEHFEQEPIAIGQRDFLRRPENINTNNLLSGQKQDSVFLSATQPLSKRLRLSEGLLYSLRSNENTYLEGVSNTLRDTSADNKHYEGHLGVDYAISDLWHVELFGTTSRQATDFFTGTPNSGPSSGIAGAYSYKVQSIDSRASGDLLKMPSGTMKIAFGAGYREEEFTGYSYVAPSRSFYFNELGDDQVRRSKNAFVEFVIPMLGNTSAISDPRLTLSVSGRYEDDNRFGDSFDPKFGLRWIISNSLQLRGSHGTSFKAPTLSQNDYTTGASVEFFADPQYTGGLYPGYREVMRLVNPYQTLQPEVGTTWTAGLDFTPEDLRGFSAHLTYFDTQYEEKIENLTSNVTLLYYDPAFASVRTIRGEIPDADFDARITAILNNTEGRSIACYSYYVPATNSCNEPAWHFSGILEAGLRNVAVTHNSGLDLLVNQEIPFRSGSFELGFNAAYLSHYYRQVTPSDPGIEFVNTVFYPRRWNARGSAGWNGGNFGLLGTVNFGSSYDNTATIPQTTLPSLTTLDFNIRYNTAQRFQQRWLNDVLVTLNVTNALDKDPPLFSNPSAGAFAAYVYDGANSNALGRRISLGFMKNW